MRKVHTIYGVTHLIEGQSLPAACAPTWSVFQLSKLRNKTNKKKIGNYHVELISNIIIAKTR